MLPGLVDTTVFPCCVIVVVNVFVTVPRDVTVRSGPVILLPVITSVAVVVRSSVSVAEIVSVTVAKLVYARVAYEVIVAE